MGVLGVSRHCPSETASVCATYKMTLKLANFHRYPTSNANMFSTLLSFTYISVLAALVVATPAASDSATDWKYSVGWDGTVLDASAVGDAVGPANFTASEAASHLEVRFPPPVLHYADATPLSQKRTVGGVYICDDVHWGGKCGYAVQPLYTCIKLGSDWNKKISSFGPDPCTFCYGASGPFSIRVQILTNSCL